MDQSNQSPTIENSENESKEKNPFYQTTYPDRYFINFISTNLSLQSVRYLQMNKNILNIIIQCKGNLHIEDRLSRKKESFDQQKKPTFQGLVIELNLNGFDKPFPKAPGPENYKINLLII